MTPRLWTGVPFVVVALAAAQGTGERAAAQNAAPQGLSPRNVAPQVLPPNLPGSGAGEPAGPPAPAPVIPPPPQWQPRTTVELKVLDKINARSLTLNGQVGQTLQFGTLTIAVRACMVHPPDQPADSTAFLDITDSREGAPAFHGWMFADEPAVSMFEHPVYDVRVTSCHS